MNREKASGGKEFVLSSGRRLFIESPVVGAPGKSQEKKIRLDGREIGRHESGIAFLNYDEMKGLMKAHPKSMKELHECLKKHSIKEIWHEDIWSASLKEAGTTYACSIILHRRHYPPIKEKTERPYYTMMINAVSGALPLSPSAQEAIERKFKELYFKHHEKKMGFAPPAEIAFKIGIYKQPKRG